jgi:hypothetical protein
MNMKMRIANRHLLNPAFPGGGFRAEASPSLCRYRLARRRIPAKEETMAFRITNSPTAKTRQFHQRI